MFGKATSSSFMAIIILSCTFFLGQGCHEYVSEPFPPQSDNSCCLVVIVHGSGSSPDDWPLELQNAIDARLPLDVRQRWDIVRYGWEEHANNRLLASNAGLELGQQVGMMLTAEDYEYSRIHFIAHGVGSFVAHAAATTYINSADLPATIHTTYLDPVSSRDISFGDGVDFSENYFNDDDPVLFSNAALADSHNFDE